MNDMKVIFLDIDGVLNSELWYRKRHAEVDMHEVSAQYPFYEFSPELVENLNRITEETGAKIVVSSTWRLGRSVEELQTLLKNVGVKGEVIDKTDHLGSPQGSGYTIPRGCEIAVWLKSKKFQRINWSRERQQEYLEKSEVKNYVILDDDSDMLHNQREHFVKTSWQKGLSTEMADEAIQILNSTIESLYYPADVYCPACGACGEDGCCGGEICRKMECYYGETYKKEYAFNKKVHAESYKLMEEVKAGKWKIEEIHSEFERRWDTAWEEIFKR